MPKTNLQKIIFTIMMASVMVYAMICYNIAISKAGMTNEIFGLAFRELVLMLPIAFILEFFIVEKLSLMLAFRILKPDDRPFLIQLTISCIIVCLMCPMMSFVATVLFKNAGNQLIAQWLQTTVMNFPMALCWQIFFAGPIVRSLFNIIFKKQLENQVTR